MTAQGRSSLEGTDGRPSSIHDVSGRGQTEEALRQAEERYRGIFENAVEGIFQTSLDGRYVAANPALARMLGYDSPEELMASVTDVDQLYVEPGGREDFIREMQENATLVEFEYRVYQKDGNTIWVSEKVRGVWDETGSLVGFEGTTLDVTERKQAEQDRRRLLQRLVSAQEAEHARIAAGIHDDPIQKMSAVGIRLGTLRRSIEGAEQLALLDDLQETVALSIASLRHLLFELRPPALDREGLAAALRQDFAEYASEAGATFRLESRLVDEPAPEIRVLAYRVLHEALANVRKHAHATRVEILLEPREEGLRARIRDDGVGFLSAENADRSSGHLGLPSMRERVELAGGWWRIRSAPGAGTTVEFWLPPRVGG